MKGIMAGFISKSLVASAAIMALSSAFSGKAFAEDAGLIKVESTTIDDRFELGKTEPLSVEVVKGEEVDRAHAEHLQQILQSIPGVTTELQGGDSVKIHIRGVENQAYMGEKPGVAIVIDGVPVFERTGRVNIDLDNIESVKVVKGGASYLFGDDALSGAVIITTKRGAKLAGYKVEGESGSFGYKKGLARAGFASEKSNGHVQVSTRSSDGYYYQSDYKADYINGKYQYYLTEASDITAGLELSNRAKDSHGTVTGVTQALTDPQSYDGRDYARMYDVKLQKYYVTYSRGADEGNNLLLSAYQYMDYTKYKSSPQKYTSTGATVTDVDAYTTDNGYDQAQRGLKGEWRAGSPALAWMAGADLRANVYKIQDKYLVDFKSSPKSSTVYYAGDLSGDNKTDEGVYAAYGEIKGKLFDPLTLTLNGRFDQIKLDYDDTLYSFTQAKTYNEGSWRAGANYSITADTNARVGVSTGFRAPTIQQLFAGDVNPTGKTASNPDLVPEKSLSYEAGVKTRASAFGLGVDVDLGAFQIDRTDYILSSSGLYSDPAKGEVSQYQNIGGARHRGVELSVITDQTKPVSLDIAYTFLDATFTEYENFNLILGNRYVNPTIEKHNLTGNKIPRTPDHRINLRLTARPLSGLEVSGEMDSISSYYADELNYVKFGGQTVFNLMAAYDVKTQKYGTWSLFCRVDNVLSRYYYNTARGSYDANADGVFNEEDISITVNPGRAYTVGLTGNF